MDATARNVLRRLIEIRASERMMRPPITGKTMLPSVKVQATTQNFHMGQVRVPKLLDLVYVIMVVLAAAVSLWFQGHKISSFPGIPSSE